MPINADTARTVSVLLPVSGESEELLSTNFRFRPANPTLTPQLCRRIGKNERPSCDGKPVGCRCDGAGVRKDIAVIMFAAHEVI